MNKRSLTIEFVIGESYASIEKRIFLAVYYANDQNTARTARDLRISSRTIIRRLRDYGIGPKPSLGSPLYSHYEKAKEHEEAFNAQDVV